MRCPGSTCGAENADNRRYCGQCGRALRTICGRCGFANCLSDRFCGGCGVEMRLQAAAPPPPPPRPAARTATMPAPAPAPAPAPVAAATTASGVRTITESELDALLGAAKPSANEAAAPSLPREQLGQDDIDRLFGAA
jgi:hypothetical protein